jgi:hypothetical protein
LEDSQRMAGRYNHSDLLSHSGRSLKGMMACLV